MSSASTLSRRKSRKLLERDEYAFNFSRKLLIWLDICYIVYCKEHAHQQEQHFNTLKFITLFSSLARVSVSLSRARKSSNTFLFCCKSLCAFSALFLASFAALIFYISMILHTHSSLHYFMYI